MKGPWSSIEFNGMFMELHGRPWDSIKLRGVFIRCVDRIPWST